MLTVAEVGERMGIGPTGVRNLIKDGKLLAVRDDAGVLVVPAELLDGELPVKHLSGVLTLLRDGGFTEEQALAWLTTADDTLPGTPLQALHENRATEIKRRAQAEAL